MADPRERKYYVGHWAKAAPERPAVVMAETGEVVTYAQLDERSNRVAHLLRQRGVERGDVIAILLDNSASYLDVCWAAQRSGVVYTPINWHLTAGEIEYIVNDCGAKALFASARLGDQVGALDGRLPGIAARFSVDGAIPDFEPLEEAVAGLPTTPRADETEGADMIYSSGTTGRPKGGRQPLVDVAAGAIDPAALGFFALFGLDERTVYLSPGAPLYHAAPLRFCMAVNRLGGTNVILSRFDPVGALEAIERHRVTHSQWVPTMFVRMMRLPEAERRRHDVSSLRIAIHAAAPCPVPVKEAMLDWWGPVIHEYYGGSEGGGITYIGPQDWLAHKGSVGRSAVGVVHIVDEDGEELPPGEVGAIYFENARPIEYHNDPEKTKKAHHPKGWASIGDVGYLDDEGYLYLTDRRDFMIIAGGVNIYPQETEDVLITHPMVVDVAVIGVPNEDLGEEVKAVVQLGDMAQASPELEAQLIAYCRERLSRQKCPRSVDFVPELPRSPAGKLYKKRVRDAYWRGRDDAIQDRRIR